MTLLIPGTREGSCPGDSGGILMSDDWIPEIEDYRAVQKAVVRGSVKACDGERFPTMFNRLDVSETLSWINERVFGKSKFNYYDKVQTNILQHILTCQIIMEQILYLDFQV